MGVSRDCPNFLSTPIISRTDKATNFKFCMHILSIDRNKNPLQISGKVAGAFARSLETFQGTHILGASRGRLCNSKAFLYINCQHFCLVLCLGEKIGR